MNKIYEPDVRINRRFGNAEITFITNEKGEPATLFIGKRKENGDISGERYVRRTKTEGGMEKVHWENKGRV